MTRSADPQPKTQTQTNQTQTNQAQTRTVTLSRAVTIDGKDAREITLRCPKTGELRGLMLANVLQMETGAVMKLLSRITAPPLSEAQLGDLAPADFMALTQAAIGFFVSAQVAQEIEARL